MVKLTQKEKDIIKNLKPKFNIVDSESDINIRASKRVDVASFWSKRLIKLSLLMNILSLLICFITVLNVVLEPAPLYYAAMPNGQVVGPLQKAH